MSPISHLLVMAVSILLLGTSPTEASYSYSEQHKQVQCVQNGNGHPIIEETPRTFAECKERCVTYVDDQGRSCVAIEFQDGGVLRDDSYTAVCYLAWGCDDLAGWGGGSVFYLQQTDTVETTIAPTTDPTIAPTSDPTIAPTSDPTIAPTTDPTIAPTTGPTAPSTPPTAAPVCAQELTSVNWHSLFHGGSDQGNAFLNEYSVSWNAQSFSLTFSATLQYVGLSADGDLSDAFDLGTTYWVDLQSFDQSADQINQPGSCGNRRSTDYDGLNYTDWWEYPADSTKLATVSSGQRTAYPPSDWSLTAPDCAKIKYERTLSLTALLGCTDAKGGALVDKVQSDNVVTFSGSFFVEMVSPYTMSSKDYHRVYPLVQHQFAVELARTVNVTASTGVTLIVSSALSLSHDDAGNYVLRVLTQSADYISLSGPNVVSKPSGLTVSAIAEETDSCIDQRFMCTQVFKLTIPSAINCTAVGGATSIDLSGTFQMAFTPQCLQSGTNSPCTGFMDELPESGTVTLDADWDFVDETCGVDLFSAQFASAMTFYKDPQFTDAVSDGDAFAIARDTVYGEIVVTVPTDDGSNNALYNLLDVSIQKVWVCTSSNSTALESSLNAVDGSGGCLATASVDGDGPYLVIGGENDNLYDGTILSAGGNNDARFSFLAFDTARTDISVHVQLLLTLQTSTGTRRRRLLLDSDPNQLRHFVGTTFTAEVYGDSDASNVTVDGDVSFYADDAFDELVLDDSAAFTIGDPIYGLIAVEIADDPSSELHSVSDVQIENVYVCTSSDPEGLSMAIADDDEYAVGGCFSTEIDPESPYFVIGHGASMQYEGAVLEVAASNEARFSFVAFDTPRDVIGVHIEVVVTVETASGQQQRRRLMVEKTHHFLGTTHIQSSVAAQAAAFGGNTETMMIAGIGGVALMAMVVFVTMWMVKRRAGGSKENNMAEHVAEMSPSSLPATTSGAVEI